LTFYPNAYSNYFDGWNMGAIWGRFLCNMGTVLVLHKQNEMQYKNRPHIAPMFHFFSEAIALICFLIRFLQEEILV